VALTILLGYLFALPLPRALGIDPRWGAAGLTASAGIAGWIEFLLLRRTLNRRIGSTGLPIALVSRLWGSAATAALAGWELHRVLPPVHPIGTAVLVLGAYGAVYFFMTDRLGVEEARFVIRRFGRSSDSS
jgi:putative peptidoglycan lipid II flippase